MDTGTQRGIAAGDVAGELAVQESFCFPCFWKKPRLPVSAAAWSDNCAEERDSSVGEELFIPCGLWPFFL